MHHLSSISTVIVHTIVFHVQSRTTGLIAILIKHFCLSEW